MKDRNKYQQALLWKGTLTFCFLLLSVSRSNSGLLLHYIVRLVESHREAGKQSQEPFLGFVEVRVKEPCVNSIVLTGIIILLGFTWHAKGVFDPVVGVCEKNCYVPLPI